MSSRTVVLIGLGWLLIATALGAAGIVSTLRPPAPPLILFGLTAVVLAAAWFLAGFRAWLAAIDERWLVGLHLTRFVGAYFLYLYGRGQLPYAFAVPGGLGDIGVASLAAGLLVWGSPREARRRAAYIAWNVLGLADILFVVVTAARLAAADPESMAALLRLPLSLLPTFLVPLIIASHVVLGVRLARRGAVVWVAICMVAVGYPASAGESGDDNWYEARSAGGGFSVLLPGPFNDFTQSAPTTDGKILNVHTLGMVTRAGVKFTATAMTRSDRKKFGQSEIDGVVERFEKKGSLKSKRAISLQGYPGIEFSVGDARMSARMRTYAVDDTLYQLIVEFPTSAEPSVGADINKFLDSLKLRQ